MNNLIKKVRERLPQEITMKLNCVCCGAPWYEVAYFPFTVLVKTICDVFKEEYNNSSNYDFYDCVEVVNEITGLEFVADDNDDNWNDGEEMLSYLFYEFI